MANEHLSRIDSFPYRHRVADIMHAPLASVSTRTPVVEAAGQMARLGVSSLVAVDSDGLPIGIVTERDMVRAFSINVGGGAVGDIMSAPVITIPEDVFMFVAMGRMERRDLRHLVVVDELGRAVGMLTSRALLKIRSANILSINDELSDAGDANDLGHVREQLPVLAEKLLAENVSALDVSCVISAVYCDMTRRAWEMAVRHMETSAAGPQPAPCALLVLGSGGRCESMLKPDQDNALVHSGTDDDDKWFEAAATHMSKLLDDAGVPYCKGGVMASNPKWRRSLDGWKEEISNWVRSNNPDALLMVDIFFDFVVVAGDAELADRVRANALATAGSSIVFLTMLGAGFSNYSAPIGLFGRIKTTDGRIDLKLKGILPVISGSRIMALQHTIDATSTRARLGALVDERVLVSSDAMALMEAHELIQKIILEQQIADIKEGLDPSSWVNPRSLSPWHLGKLKNALKSLEGMHLLVHDSLSKMSEHPKK